MNKTLAVLIIILASVVGFVSGSGADGSSWYGEKPPVTVTSVATPK